MATGFPNAYSNISSEDSRTPEMKFRSKQICEYVASLFRNDIFADFSIAVGADKIKVHKFVLSAQSSVFRAMFEGDYKENSNNELVIEDFNFDVVLQMLEFVYTGKASKIGEMAEDLLTISQKYDLKILKRKCERWLVTYVCISNALALLVLADRNQADKLEEAAIDFIKRYYAGVRETKDWDLLRDEHPKLLEKVTDACANYSSRKKTKFI